MLDALFELIFEFLIEVLLQPLIELGLEIAARFFRRRPTLSTVLAYLLTALFGAFLGLMLSNMFPSRVFPVSTARGITLALSPLCAGLIMKGFGDWRRAKGHEPTILATFWGGAIFTFAVALVRWMRVK